MSAHTPGPWYVSPEIVREPGLPDRKHFEVYRKIGTFGHPATCYGEADARLIAAAPDLLETLKRVLEQVDGYDLKDEPFASARAAIAKAEGKS